MNRKNKIEGSFNNIFSEYKNNRIAVYGLGEYAEWIIKTYPDYNIVGLLDRWASSGIKYGKPILTYKDLIVKGVSIIIIAAGKENTEIIRKRIACFCNDNNIRLFSLEGEELIEGNKNIYSFNRRIDQIIKRPYEEIKNFGVVCFRAEDIFVQHRFNWRIKNEDLYGNIEYLTVHNIYRMLFNVSREIGIKIYFICDDSNIPAVLDKILHEYDIYGYEAIIPYSRIGSLLDDMQEKCLIIGKDKDNLLCSPENGVEYVQSYSSFEIARESGFCDCMEAAAGKKDQIYRGLIVSGAFADPCRIDGMGRIYVKEPYELGYIFLGPLITDFMLWLTECILENQYNKIIFSARDGYLFQIMYEYLRKTGRYGSMPDSEYLLISRYMAMLGGLITQEDILKCVEIIFDGDAELMLQKRFLLSRKDIIPYSECGDMFVADYILLHQDAILNKAAQIRENYQKYLYHVGISSEFNVLFFDLVASGSCQNIVQNFMGVQFDGAYFMRMPTEDKQKQNLNIYSYHEFDNDFADHSMLMECILTSMQPTLLYIDKDMSPVYGPELRSAEELGFVSEAQKGIFDFFVEFLDVYKDKKEERKTGIFPDMLYGHIISHYTEIDNTVFDHYILKDEIFNQSNNVLNKCMV